MRRLPLSVCLACLLALIAVTPAAAQGVYEDFRNDGKINACQYSDQQLQRALDGLPPDILQYAPGFADQLAAGREGCGGAAPGSRDTRDFQTVPVPGSAGSGAGGSGGADAGAGGGGRGGLDRGGAGAGAGGVGIAPPPAAEASDRIRLAGAAPTVSATTGTTLPGWVVALLIAVAALAALAALARRRELDVAGRTAPLRAAFREAAGRTADAAATAFDGPLRR